MSAKRTVDSIMTREIIAFAPETSVVTAARILATRHIGGAPVIDDNGAPVGVVTLTDLADPDRARSDEEGQSLYYHIVDGEIDAKGTTTLDNQREGIVSDVMSPYVFSVAPATGLIEAMRLMVSDNIHRLMVCEGRQLVGIVSSMDMLRAFTEVGDLPKA